MKPYEPWEFCKHENCVYVDRSQEFKVNISCENCLAYRFHSYLSANKQILEPGSDLARLVEALMERRKVYKDWNEKYIEPVYEEIKNYFETMQDLDRQIDEILSRLEELK